MSSRARLFFSFRSPYSWLTINRLRVEMPDLFGRVELIPYWDPDPRTEGDLRERGAEFHYVQMSKAKHLYLLLDTKRLSQRLGLTMAWPIDLDPCWEVPHLAWLLARDQGLGEAFYTAVTQARWHRAENICDPQVIARLARDVGLDPDAAQGAAHDPGLRRSGVDCLVRAYEDDVFGIPYLRAGRHRFWGYDRVDWMLDALRDPGGPARAGVGPDRGDSPVAAVAAGARAYDSDTSGGCG